MSSKPDWAVDLSGKTVEDLGDTLEDIADGNIANPASTQSDPDHEPYEKMTLHDLMVRMRRLQVEELLGRLESGTATHQELAIIQRLLNDSGYVIDRDPDSPGAPANKSTRPMDLPELEEDYE
jgi:hypothetical protein